MTKIVPVMDYASSIWGYKPYFKADTLHNRVVRFFLGVHKCTINPAIQGGMVWTPAQIRRQLNSLRLSKRLITMDNNRLTKCIFLWDLHKCNNNWSKDVKSMFKSINCIATFNAQLLIGFTSSNFITSVCTHLMSIYRERWLNDVSYFECENFVKNEFK